MSYKRNITRYSKKKQYQWIKGCIQAYSLRRLHGFTTRMYTLCRADGKALTVTNKTSSKELENFKDGTEYYKTIYNQVSVDGKPYADLATLKLFNNSNTDMENKEEK